MICLNFDSTIMKTADSVLISIETCCLLTYRRSVYLWDVETIMKHFDPLLSEIEAQV